MIPLNICRVCALLLAKSRGGQPNILPLVWYKNTHTDPAYPGRVQGQERTGFIKYNKMIQILTEQGGFIWTKQDNPDVIEKQADLSEVDYEPWINVDSNLEKAQIITEETKCQALMSRRHDPTELEGNDDEKESAEKPLSKKETRNPSYFLLLRSPIPC
ncbi:hypothetical protein AVEN_216358-1 [Araneus ventricosus]|uniref:Uncharacterized protein n=1 Tax=Araneus ventricosus TaxID=182803 RepID=A0A4Y2GXH1_ARAVE|nr:hypothetical protein AVEN_216358-1 [Araneus ventricosus]